jgi:hypothetical protein
VLILESDRERDTLCRKKKRRGETGIMYVDATAQIRESENRPQSVSGPIPVKHWGERILLHCLCRY